MTPSQAGRSQRGRGPVAGAGEKPERGLAATASLAAAGGRLTIDLDAVAHNYGMLRKTAGRADCAAVVKADGYGLGATRVVARLLAAGCREFFVATAHEAVALRDLVQPPARLYVLAAPVAEALATLVPLGIVPVLNCVEDVEAATAYGRRARRAVPVAIHLDSGLARLGLAMSELPRLRARPIGSSLGIELVLSHLANAGDANDPLNADQLKFFERVTEAFFPGVRRSFAASSGTFLGPAYHFEQVRSGAALYGINPVPEMPNPMRPVVRLRARVLQVRSVPAGTGVGYGPLFRTRRRSRIATIALGYADGLLRSGSNRACLWFGASRLPVVGAVSMDCVSVDATDVANDRLCPGSWVDVLGPRQSVDDLAGSLGTIGYEVLTSLGRRFHRQYVGA